MKIWFLSSSAKGCRLALRIKDALKDEECHLYCKTRAEHEGSKQIEVSHKEWGALAFKNADAVIFVGAIGIAVRTIAPHVRSKVTDPAVVVVDEMGLFSIPLLSGHIGGSNRLAHRIADALGSVPVITTATDINGKISIDSFAADRGMHIGSMNIAKFVSSAILDDKPVGLFSDFRIEGRIPDGMVLSESGDIGVCVTHRTDRDPYKETLVLTPRCLVVGVGCREGVPKERIMSEIDSALKLNSVSGKSIRSLASINIKKGETGLLEAAGDLGVPVAFFSARELNSMKGEFSRSEFVESVTGVDCVCERAAVAASDKGKLILRKTSNNGVTVALALDDYVLRTEDS